MSTHCLGNTGCVCHQALCDDSKKKKIDIWLRRWEDRRGDGSAFYFNLFIFKEPIRIGDVFKMGTMVKNWPFSFFFTSSFRLDLRLCVYEFKYAYSGKSYCSPFMYESRRSTCCKVFSCWTAYGCVSEVYMCVCVRCSAGFGGLFWGGLIYCTPTTFENKKKGKEKRHGSQRIKKKTIG